MINFGSEFLRVTICLGINRFVDSVTWVRVSKLKWSIEQEPERSPGPQCGVPRAGPGGGQGAVEGSWL